MIAAVDEFIICDYMQYTHRDWRNRNQIKTPHRVATDQFRKIVNSHPKDNRHWLQIFGCGKFDWLIEVINPRYKYLCKT